MISEYLLRVAAENYGFDKVSCRFIAYGRENNKRLYTFDVNHKPYILRFMECNDDYLNKTKAEMHWLSYLSDNGVSVPSPLRSRNGMLAVSAQENGETYLLSAFSMVDGRSWNKDDSSLWSASVFYNWGKVVGDMHRLTKDYKPSNDFERRDEFNILGMISDNIKDFPTVVIIAENILNEIDALPRDRDSYGLIHNDLHPNNFLIDGERINLFDFDGCAYSWYVFDIANALYLALWLGRSNQAGIDFANDIIRYFLKGYLSANTTNNLLLSKIPLFMMLCKISLFSFGGDCENPENTNNDDCREERLHNIENNILFTGCEIDSDLFRNC